VITDGKLHANLPYIIPYSATEQLHTIQGRCIVQALTKKQGHLQFVSGILYSFGFWKKIGHNYTTNSQPLKKKHSKCSDNFWWTLLVY